VAIKSLFEVTAFSSCPSSDKYTETVELDVGKKGCDIIEVPLAFVENVVQIEVFDSNEDFKREVEAGDSTNSNVCQLHSFSLLDIWSKYTWKPNQK